MTLPVNDLWKHTGAVPHEYLWCLSQCRWCNEQDLNAALVPPFGMLSHPASGGVELVYRAKCGHVWLEKYSPEDARTEAIRRKAEAEHSEDAVDDWEGRLAAGNHRSFRNTNLRRCGLCHTLDVEVDVAVELDFDDKTPSTWWPLCVRCADWRHTVGLSDAQVSLLASFLAVRAVFDARRAKNNTIGPQGRWGNVRGVLLGVLARPYGSEGLTPVVPQHNCVLARTGIPHVSCISGSGGSLCNHYWGHDDPALGRVAAEQGFSVVSCLRDDEDEFTDWLNETFTVVCTGCGGIFDPHATPHEVRLVSIPERAVLEMGELRRLARVLTFRCRACIGELMNGTSTVKFYRSDKQTAIWTDAIDEGQFFDACAQRLPEVVALCEPEDVPLLLSYWLPQIHDIACKLKGYKTESVQEQRVLIAGNWIPTADAEVK